MYEIYLVDKKYILEFPLWRRELSILCCLWGGSGSIFSLARWVKDPALLQLGYRLQPWLRFDPWPRNSHMLWMQLKKKKKKPHLASLRKTGTQLQLLNYWYLMIHVRRHVFTLMPQDSQWRIVLRKIMLLLLFKSTFSRARFSVKCMCACTVCNQKGDTNNIPENAPPTHIHTLYIKNIKYSNQVISLLWQSLSQTVHIFGQENDFLKKLIMSAIDTTKKD